jgi:hypothetical protein
MTEIEYVRSTNWTKIRMAQRILSYVLEGDDYGVPLSEYRDVMERLQHLEHSVDRSFWVSED